MNAKRCYGCMQPIGDGVVCPHCGYDMRSTSALHQIPPGTVLRDQYLVGKVLGQGGFGITYLGWDRLLNTPVAIKEYYPNGIVMRDSAYSLRVTNCEDISHSLFENNRRRFLREAQSLAQLAHIPEVVHVRNFFEENNTAYIIMEYLSGRTLKDYVRGLNRTLTLPETFRILRPVMHGLAKVHEQGIVHRDISPDNIMLNRDGSVKLLDFGAVREVENAEVDKELTKSTETILKQGYAPMEQYQKRGTLGPWTDVYALCATIFWCLTGSAPADAPGLLMEEQEIPWNEIPGLSEAQAEVLIAGTQLLPRNRIRSMEELEQRLVDALYAKEASTPAKPPAPAKKPSPETAPKAVPRERGKGKYALIGLLAVLMLAGAFLLGRAAFSPEPVSMDVPNQTVEKPSQTESEETVPPETETVPEGTSADPGVRLDQLDRKTDHEYGVISYGDYEDTFGNLHEDALMFKVANRADGTMRAQTEYYLYGNYTTFSGVICCEAGTEIGADVKVSVRLDGKRILYKEEITRGTNYEFSVDVTGGKVLRVECVAARSEMSHCVIDAGVYQDAATQTTTSVGAEAPLTTQSPPTAQSGTPITQLELDYISDDVTQGDWTDTFGTLHTESVLFHAATRQNPGKFTYASYYLPEGGTTFTGVICGGEDMEPGAEMNVQIWLSGKCVYTLEGITRDTYEEFTLDLKGDKLQIHCYASRPELGYCILEGYVS